MRRAPWLTSNPRAKYLRLTFGFDDFLPGQGEAIGALLDGEDVFALWPTGGGKSLIYQLPAVARPGLTVVVSPLIALMRDQTQKLKKLGIAAAGLHADLDPATYKAIRDRLERRRLSLLYLSPERLANADTLALLRAAEVQWLAVDEAHCVSQMIATTATAAPQTRADIIANLFARAARHRRLFPPQRDRAVGHCAQERRDPAGSRAGCGSARSERHRLLRFAEDGRWAGAGARRCGACGGGLSRRPARRVARGASGWVSGRRRSGDGRDHCFRAGSRQA